MKRKKQPFAGRLARKILVWVLVFTVGIAYFVLRLEKSSIRQFYIEIYLNKMLVNYEYTRRVISDVYVAVINNIYHIEQTLDNPDGHKDTMERIVKSGTRVRSCGISFIKDYYYPQYGHQFCPYAWRNVANPDVIWKENLGDAALGYFDAKWFLDVLLTDSAQWSEPFYDGQDKKTPLAAYMAPIHDKTGRVVAVLGADLSLDWLTGKLSEMDSTMNSNPMIAANKLGLKSKSYIINSDGSFITNDDDTNIMTGNFFKTIKSCEGSSVEKLINNMQQGLQSDESHQEKYLVNDEECFIFYAPMKHTKWIIVSVVPCHAIDMLGTVNGIGVFLILFVALMFMVLVCYYCTKREIMPVKQLTSTIDEMASGKLDAAMPEIKYNDEISDLRDSVGKMQYALSNYIDKKKGKSE